MSKEQAIPFIIILIYIITTMILGILPYGKKRIDTVREFHSVSENTGSLVIFLCLMATAFTSSTWTTWLSFAYNSGVFATYCAVYMACGGVLYYFLVQKVHPCGQEKGVMTMAGLFLEKYGSNSLAYTAAIVSIVNACFWIVMEIKTMGSVVNVIFENRLSPVMALSIGVLVVLVYILWSGLESVIWTSCFQGVIVTAGGIILCVILFTYLFDSFSDFGRLMEHRSEYILIDTSAKSDINIYLWISYIIQGSVGCICLPQIFSRMYMGRNVRVQKKAAVAFSFSGFWCLFFILIAFFAIAAGIQEEGSQPLIFTLIKLTENPYFLGFTYVLLIAASMATLDITLLSISTIITMDIFENILGHKKILLSQYRYITLSRVVIIATAILCLCIALFYKSHPFNLALHSYEMVIHLFPLLMFACYSEKCNSRVAWAALMSGFVSLFLFKITGWPLLGFSAGFCSLLINAAVIIFYVVIRKN